MDFFEFPDRYRNAKTFGKDRFLKYANLTDKEKECLEQFLVDIQVEYKIMCRDNVQVMVFSVDVNTLRSHELSYICGILSKSTWRPSLFLIKDGDHGKLCTAIKEEGQNGRGRVISQTSTRLFRISEPDPYVWNILEKLNDDVDNWPSDELIKCWYNAIELNAGPKTSSLIGDDGVLYEIVLEKLPETDIDGNVLFDTFEAWYEETIRPLFNACDHSGFLEFDNKDIFVEDFTSLAPELFRKYLLHSADEKTVEDPQKDVIELFDQMTNEQLIEYADISEGDIVQWKLDYLEACVNYTLDYFDSELNCNVLFDIYSALKNIPESRHPESTSIVDFDALIMHMGKGFYYD